MNSRIFSSVIQSAYLSFFRLGLPRYTLSDISYQQFQALNDLLILLSGSLAVLAEVSFFFIPFILAQNDALLLLPTFLDGAF